VAEAKVPRSLSRAQLLSDRPLRNRGLLVYLSGDCADTPGMIASAVVA
jgi:hypothetical protein